MEEEEEEEGLYLRMEDTHMDTASDGGLPSFVGDDVEPAMGTPSAGDGYRAGGGYYEPEMDAPSESGTKEEKNCLKCRRPGRRCKCPCIKCGRSIPVTTEDDVVDAVMPMKTVANMDMAAQRADAARWFHEQHYWEQCGCEPPQWRYLKSAKSPWTVWKTGQILRKEGYVRDQRKGLRKSEARAGGNHPRDQVVHVHDSAQPGSGQAPSHNPASGADVSGDTPNAAREAYQQRLLGILGPWEGHLLHLFFDKEQENLAREDPITFQAFKNYVEGLETDTEGDHELRSEFYEAPWVAQTAGSTCAHVER